MSFCNFMQPHQSPSLNLQQCPSNDSTFLMDDDVLSIISDQLGIPIAKTPEPDNNFQLQISLPSTPENEKIEKILRQNLFKDPANAGRLAVRLAADVLFDEETLKASSISGDRGKLKILDPNKISDIEDIVIRMYRGKVPDIKELWKDKRVKAISKKCQSLRREQKKNKQTSLFRPCTKKTFTMYKFVWFCKFKANIV